jgi:hypothetical protein
MPDTKNLKNYWQVVVNTAKIIFEISLILYLALFLLDEVAARSVSNFLNINYILGICLVAAIFTALGKKEEPKIPPQPLKKYDYALMVGLGILAIAVVYWKIKEIGGFAWPISILSGILIFLISWLFLKDDGEKDNGL